MLKILKLNLHLCFTMYLTILCVTVKILFNIKFLFPFFTIKLSLTFMNCTSC